MGTSVSQPSPRTTSWMAVAAGYKHREISPERVATEVWRAASGEPGFAEALSSRALFDCYNAVRAAKSATEALQAVNRTILDNRNNSVVAEFAKRSVPLAFGKAEPPHVCWRANLFSQLTEYFVSRDVPGYVGSNGRFESVAELATFKRTVRQCATAVVGSVTADPATPKDWAVYVRAVLKKVTK